MVGLTLQGVQGAFEPLKVRLKQVQLPGDRQVHPDQSPSNVAVVGGDVLQDFDLSFELFLPFLQEQQHFLLGKFVHEQHAEVAVFRHGVRLGQVKAQQLQKALFPPGGEAINLAGGPVARLFVVGLDQACFFQPVQGGVRGGFFQLGEVGQVFFDTLNHDGKQLSAVMLGTDPATFMAPQVTEGRPLKASSTGAVVDLSFQQEGVKLGDTLTLKPGGETLKVTGFTEHARLNHQPVVYVTLGVFDALNPRAGGQINALALQDPEEGRGLPADLTMLTRTETLQVLPGYKEEQGSLTMIQVFLVVVAAFVMAVFFYVLTLQKTGQFGLLKAIGATTRTLAGSLIIQMLILTFTALMVAVIGTVLALQVLPEGIPFQLTPLTVAVASGVLLLVALFSSLLSLRSIARVDPLIAIGTAS